ncbi:hypothetical protein FOZ61_009791 [Perkinsus olseni]|uniref:Uncharacterized protein n=1 Tax=Perkinsus olseni TaxID=32597 RepID=A0A7J6M4R1_PEROL|nr:hypothetical protein FOZ61_009791 [Perkinsus olseni]
MRQIIDNNLSAHENSLIALLKRIRSKLKDNHHLYNIAADDSIDEDSINVLFNELEDELQLPTGSTANNPSPNVQAVKYCSSIAHRRHPHVVLDEHTRNYAPVIAAVEASRGDRTIAGCGRSSGDQGLMPSWATMGHSSSCSDEKGSTAGEDPSTFWLMPPFMLDTYVRGARRHLAEAAIRYDSGRLKGLITPHA